MGKKKNKALMPVKKKPKKPKSPPSKISPQARAALDRTKAARKAIDDFIKDAPAIPHIDELPVIEKSPGLTGRFRHRKKFKLTRLNMSCKSCGETWVPPPPTYELESIVASHQKSCTG